MPKQFVYVTSPICAAIIVAGAWLASANPPSLNPPPGPIELSGRFGPRRCIQAADIPLTINQPGSYYLAENITAAGDGITILANDVTIDLMGFTLTGGTGRGIFVSGAVGLRNNIVIRNGTVRDWGVEGVHALNARNAQLVDLQAYNNTGAGLALGEGGTISGCTARSNGSEGIVANGCTVQNCTATDNALAGIRTDACTVVRCMARANMAGGIQVGGGSTIQDCAATSNTGTGIDAGNGSTVTRCAAANNTGDGICAGFGSSVSGCASRFNGDDGILTSAGSTVTGCTVQFNTGDGIQVSSDCRVVGNTCDSNGLNGDGAGIHSTSSNNRIEGNNVTGNDRGIDVDTAGSIIIKNTASGNTGVGSPSANYDIAAGNHYGLITVNPGANFSTGQISWSNFEY